MSAPRPAFFFLGEASLPLLLWLVLRGRPVCVVNVAPRLPALAPLLARLVRWLERRGLALPPARGCPGLHDAMEAITPSRLGVYRDVEAWLLGYLGIGAAASLPADFAQPLRQETVKFSVITGIRDMWRLDYLLRECPGAPIYGADSFRRHVLSHFRHQASPTAGPGIKAWRFILNLGQAMVVCLACLAWVLRRCRLTAPAPEQAFLAIDFDGTGQERYLRFWRELCDDPADAVIVFRSPADAGEPRFQAMTREYRTRTYERDGLFAGTAALAALWRAIADPFRLLGAVGTMPPELFWRVVLLAWRRLAMRGLFNVLRPRYFWARDDYNVECVLRTQELRRVGAVSLGISHGLPAFGVIEQVTRFVDFDIYYVFTEELYRRYYRDTQPAHMRVAGVGSFGMSREQLGRLAAPRPRDIVLYCDPLIEDESTLRFAFEVAGAFPDRRLLIKMKPGRDKSAAGQHFIATVAAEAPANVALTTEDSYDLMLKASYALSSVSTVAGECLQFGLATFVVDIDPFMKHVWYREFPGLCVDNPQRVIAAIRGIEDGSQAYPWDAYGDVIDQSGRVIYDVIRQDMGLAARHPEHRIPVWRPQAVAGGSGGGAA